MLTATMPAELLDYGFLSGLEAQSEISELPVPSTPAATVTPKRGDPVPKARVARTVVGERQFSQAPAGPVQSHRDVRLRVRVYTQEDQRSSIIGRLHTPPPPHRRRYPFFLDSRGAEGKAVTSPTS